MEPRGRSGQLTGSKSTLPDLLANLLICRSELGGLLTRLNQNVTLWVMCHR